MEFVELEFGLHRREADSYAVELRVSRPDSDADASVTSRLPADRLDIENLHQKDADAQGSLLYDCLFADAKVRTAFAQARAIADDRNATLRLRLLIGPSAPELHRLYWEALRNPEDDSPLFTGERILLSRYLSSADWRPVRRRPKAELRALIVIASPTDVESYRPGGRTLAALDVPAELARAKAGLEGIACAELASGGTATLDGLVRHLRDGCDVLYLVCHGALIEGEPYIWLEDEGARSRRVAASELIQQVKELRNAPALVVLASCQSAGSGEDGKTSDAGSTFVALGPRLAEAGIPAVLAMQGDVTIATMAKFMPVFFRELQRDGQIDRAAATARGAVRDQEDWYMPVLFMRLRGGCLWYTPGFEEAQLRNWAAVLSQIQDRQWTPILGPGLTDSLLGSRREIAQHWAESYHFPMAPHNREDLPQVAQFLAINQKATTFPQSALVRYLRSDLLKRYRDELPNELREPKSDELPTNHLSKLISTLGAQRRKHDPADPFAVLARLPLPIYVTAAQNDLIADALREAGKQPRIDLFRWNEELNGLPSISDLEPAFRPDPRQPLVYHLFGRLEHPESLVLTEDDYFDFLMSIKDPSRNAFMPSFVKSAFADTGLIFLGFQLDDWNFRVMFRAIMQQEGGRGRRSKYAHVAAQIEPEEGRILEPRGARAYLESYFTEAAISIYWGSPGEFARDLLERWQEGAA